MMSAAVPQLRSMMAMPIEAPMTMFWRLMA